MNPRVRDLCEAVQAGVDVDAYCELTKDDAVAHGEIMALHRRGFVFDRDDWLSIKKKGVTCAEMCEVLEMGINVWSYIESIDANIPHAEIIALEKSGFDSVSWNWPSIRDQGITSAEMCEALDAKEDFGDYADARWVGATHVEILDVRRAHGYTQTYISARKDGRSHEEAKEHAVRAWPLESPERYWDMIKLGYQPNAIFEIDRVTHGEPDKYLNLVEQGYTHEAALDELRSETVVDEPQVRAWLELRRWTVDR